MFFWRYCTDSVGQTGPCSLSLQEKKKIFILLLYLSLVCVWSPLETHHQECQWPEVRPRGCSVSREQMLMSEMLWWFPHSLRQAVHPSSTPRPSPCPPAPPTLPIAAYNPRLAAWSCRSSSSSSGCFALLGPRHNNPSTSRSQRSFDFTSPNLSHQKDGPVILNVLLSKSQTTDWHEVE